MRNVLSKADGMTVRPHGAVDLKHFAFYSHHVLHPKRFSTPAYLEVVKVDITN